MTDVDLVVRAPRAVTATGDAVSVGVTDGRIVAVEPYASPPRGRRTVELDEDVVLLPGLVDTHVHVNEPGRTEWEGFATATRAAAAGGVTTIVDMPLNSVPPTVDVPALEVKRAAAQGHCLRRRRVLGRSHPRQRRCHCGGCTTRASSAFKCFLLDSGVPEFPPLGPGGARRAPCGAAELRGPAARPRRGRRGHRRGFGTGLSRLPRLTSAGGREPRDRRGDRGGPRAPGAAPTSCTCPAPTPSR